MMVGTIMSILSLTLVILGSSSHKGPSRWPRTILACSSLFAQAAPAKESSFERRRRRREEREEREKFWREEGYKYVENDEDVGQRSGSDSDSHNFASPTNLTLSLGSLFVTRRPRDLLEGVRLAFSNTLRGGFYGLAVLIAAPIGGLKYGIGGGLLGLVSGAIVGALMPLAGLVVGGYQLLKGAMETPTAFMDGFIRCKVWNEEGGNWSEYRLDDDLEEITRSLKEEEKKSGGRGSSSSYSSSGRRVKSTEYYDLLGVPTDSPPSKIRSAYRKMARVVHPDKNPNDPEAEKRFRELSAAYQTLSDPDKRKKYDSSGVGVDPESPEGANDGAMIDPIVFFAVLFGSERVEPYIGELGVAMAFGALLKLGGGEASFESWEDIKSAFGWSEAALKRRRRETDIAIHLRKRISDYVDGYLAPGAFSDSCWEEAVGIAKGGSYGASFLLAIGPALVAEADAFLGYRSSVVTSWRGPVSNARRKLLSIRRKLTVAGTVLRTAKESLRALYESAEVVPDGDEEQRRRRLAKDGAERRRERVVFNDKDLLKDNMSKTIPTVLDMAWAINFVDISNTLYGACSKLFHDADVLSWEERLRRAEAVRILGSQFWTVGLEVTGGNATRHGDVDDIKAQANAAFMESLRRGRSSSASDEM